MRRLARHLFTLCSAAALVLCGATVALWVRSASRQDAIVHGRAGGRLLELRSLNGTLYAAVSHPWPADQPLLWHSDTGGTYDNGSFAVLPEPSTTKVALDLGGIVAYEQQATVYPDPDGTVPWEVDWFPRDVPASAAQATLPTVTERVVQAPLWLIAVAFGAVPLARLAGRGIRLLQRRRRARANRCPSCGYDVRASPERCPECGASTPAAEV